MTYADDTQLYISTKPNISSINQSINEINICIKLIRQFFLTHQLKINDDKTEFAILGTRQQLSKINMRNIHITVGQSFIYPSDSVVNLGVSIDSKYTFKNHINSICKKSYYQLIKLNQIKSYVTPKVMESLVHSFISSNIDYCNSLFVHLPKKSIYKLQKIQNSAARLITGTYRYSHITPVLIQLHWLPVVQRIKFKILILVFKCLNNMAPSYLSDRIVKYTPTRTLRSSTSLNLVVPDIHNNFGKRSFYYAGPTYWNSLPHSIKSISSFTMFKNKLKTFLFNEYF